MKVSDAAKLYLEYHRSHSKENSLRAYERILSKFCEDFGDESMEGLRTDRVLSFLNRVTEGNKK
jgi:integrase-like protein